MIEMGLALTYPAWVMRLMEIATDETAPQAVRHAAIELLAQYGYAQLRFGNETQWEHQLKFDERLDDSETRL